MRQTRNREPETVLRVVSHRREVVLAGVGEGDGKALLKICGCIAPKKAGHSVHRLQLIAQLQLRRQCLRNQQLIHCTLHELVRLGELGVVLGVNCLNLHFAEEFNCLGRPLRCYQQGADHKVDCEGVLLLSRVKEELLVHEVGQVRYR